MHTFQPVAGHSTLVLVKHIVQVSPILQKYSRSNLTSSWHKFLYIPVLLSLPPLPLVLPRPQVTEEAYCWTVIQYTEGDLTIDFGPEDMTEEQLERFHTASILEKVESKDTLGCVCSAP